MSRIVLVVESKENRHLLNQFLSAYHSVGEHQGHDQFEEAMLNPAPVRIKVAAIPSESRLWEALKRADTATQVRRIYSQSKIWLKPRLEFPNGRFIEYWPFRRILYKRAEAFCRAKLDPRYPGRDQRKSGDYRRVEYLARVMAGLTVRLGETGSAREAAARVLGGERDTERHSQPR